MEHVFLTESDSQNVSSFGGIPERYWGHRFLFKKHLITLKKSQICLFLKIQKFSLKCPQIWFTGSTRIRNGSVPELSILK